MQTDRNYRKVKKKALACVGMHLSNHTNAKMTDKKSRNALQLSRFFVLVYFSGITIEIILN